MSVGSSHRIVFVGTRGHQGNVLRELSSVASIDVVGFCAGGDSADGLAKWAAERKLSVPVFDDIETLLDQTKPTLCVICGPFELHASQTLAAIRRGIHVIAEKPVALTFDELAQLEMASAATPSTQLAGMMFSRFDPGFFHAWQLIRQGAIGEIRLLNVRKSYRLGKRGAFYADRKTYGGTIPWVGSHAIDWAMWFANAVPQRVFATHSSLHNGGNGTMERSAACLMEFANGVAATASIDVFRPEAAPSHGDDWARIVGTTGVIEARPDRVEIIDAAGSRTITPPPPSQNFLQVFLGQIAGTNEAIIDARQTFDLTRVLLAARQSADEGRLVSIS